MSATLLLLACLTAIGQTEQVAQRDFEIVFGKEIAQAKTAKDYSVLSQKLLDTAYKLADDPIGKSLVLKNAKKFAIKGRNKLVAIKVVEELAKNTGENDVDKGHELWDVGNKLDAAEIYFRALPNLKGLNKKLVEKRLEELGYKGEYLDTKTVTKLFNLGNDWKCENDVFEGKVKNALNDSGWKLYSLKEPLEYLEFSFQIKAPNNQGIRIDVEQTKFVVIMGAFNNTKLLALKHYFADTSKNISDYSKAGKMDPTIWHTIRSTVINGSIEVQYDNKTVYKADAFQKEQAKKKYKIMVGFGGHEETIQVKNVSIKQTR